MPSRRTGHERNPPAFTVFELKLDVPAFERLHRSRSVPAELLLRLFKLPARIALRAEWRRPLAAQIAVFPGATLHKAPVHRILAELRHRPTEEQRPKCGALQVGRIGAQGSTCTP